MKTNVVVYRNSISRISRCAFADLGAQRPQRQRLLHRVRRRGAAVGPLQLQAQLRRHADHLGSDRIPGLPPQDRTDRRQRRWGLRDNHLVSSSTEHCPELMVTETQPFRLLNETWGRSDRSKLRRRPAQEEALWFQFQSLKLFSRDDSHWQQTPQGHMKYLRQLSEPNLTGPAAGLDSYSVKSLDSLLVCYLRICWKCSGQKRSTKCEHLLVCFIRQIHVVFSLCCNLLSET